MDTRFRVHYDSQMMNGMEFPNFNFSDDSYYSADFKSWLLLTIDDHPILRQSFKESRAAILLADISEGRKPEWASINGDLEVYGASVPKLAILSGILYNSIEGSGAQKNVLQDFSAEISKMIKSSDNLESGKLFALTSLSSMKAALRKLQLYDWDDNSKSGRGGMWCGAAYNTAEAKAWFNKHPEIANKYPLDFSEETSPKCGHLFALTALSGAHFLLLMESGRLFNEECSIIAKNFLEKITTSKFLKGIGHDDDRANWYGKTGTFAGNLSEVSLIEGENYKYILSFLITGHRDNEVFEYLGKAANSFIRTRLRT